MDSFDGLSYDDEIRYVGPDDVDAPAVTPKEYKQPYRFRYVSMGGALACHTKFNGIKNLAPDHPCNNPAYWERVEA